MEPLYILLMQFAIIYSGRPVEAFLFLCVTRKAPVSRWKLLKSGSPLPLKSGSPLPLKSGNLLTSAYE
jgi:hypothetical protein